MLLPVSHEAPVEQSQWHGEDAYEGTQRGIALLVEDEPLVRASTADMLSELGFEVVEAENADKALRLIEAERPSLVITDHLMPGLSGTELARRLAVEAPGLPVILVSGYADAEGLPLDVPRLTKPFRRADLASLVNRLLPQTAR